MHPTILIKMDALMVAELLDSALADLDYRVLRSFDWQEASRTLRSYHRSQHAVEKFKCQYVVMLAYPLGELIDSAPLVIAIHGDESVTYLSFLEGRDEWWLAVIRSLFERTRPYVDLAGDRRELPKKEISMESKTFLVPNINCGHCTHAIQMELGELPGVNQVQALVDSKEVTVEWESPATWELIQATLVEINYPPAE